MDDINDQEPGEQAGTGRGAPRPRGEGVRIIGAEEAAKAVETGQVAGRRPENEPRFGDVPAAPSGPRAPHRFPLPDSVDPAAMPRPPLASDPSPERGRRVQGTTRVASFPMTSPGDDTLRAPAPIDYGPGDDNPRHHGPTDYDPGAYGPTSVDYDPGPGGPAPMGPVDDPAMAAAPLGGSPVGPAPRAAYDEELGDWTALAGPTSPAPGMANPPPAEPRDAPDWAGGQPLGQSQPPEMLHWADPPTGEVPRILADEPAGEADDLRAWSNLIGPSWRDRHSTWEDPVYEPAMLADEDQGAPVGLNQAAADPTGLLSFDQDLPGHPGTSLGGVTQVEGPLAEPGGSDQAPPARRIRIGRPRPSQAPPSPPGGRQELGVRVATGVGFFVLTLALFKLGPLPSLLLALVVVVLAAAEGFAALRQVGHRPATLLGLTATASLMIASYLKGETAVPLILALMVAFSLLWYLAGVARGRPSINVAMTWLGFMWVGFLGSFAALLLNPRIFPDRHGVAFLLGALLATAGHDIGAWVIGGRFGNHPLAPAISPNKTWEGLVGGMASAILVSVVITSQIHPWTFTRAAALGLVVAVVAPLGDLCESMIKRDIGVKDMGSLLPGHGGMLDRVDALLFVLPATYYLVRLLKIG